MSPRRVRAGSSQLEGRRRDLATRLHGPDRGPWPPGSRRCTVFAVAEWRTRAPFDLPIRAGSTHIVGERVVDRTDRPSGLLGTGIHLHPEIKTYVRLSRTTCSRRGSLSTPTPWCCATHGSDTPAERARRSGPTLTRAGLIARLQPGSSNVLDPENGRMSSRLRRVHAAANRSRSRRHGRSGADRTPHVAVVPYLARNSDHPVTRHSAPKCL